MNILERIFQRSSTPPDLARKESAAYQLHYLNTPQPVWSTRNYDSFVREGFRQNVIAYQAINLLATAISSLQWQAVREGEVLSQHPLRS